MPAIQTLTRTRITGEVENIRFENPENGFAVITFHAADGSRFAAKGIFNNLTRGQFLEADGYFEDHPDEYRGF